MTPGAIHHIAVTTTDPRALADFYRSVLGLTETRVNTDDAGLYSVWLECGDVILMIERGEAPMRPDGSNGLHLLALKIDAEEREAWIARLETHGVTIENTSDFTLYFRDPDGNRLGLSSWPSQA